MWLIDKLKPGSLSDWIIVIVAVGGAIALFGFFSDTIGGLALAPLAALFGQGNNKKRAEQAKQEAEFHSEQADIHLADAANSMDNGLSHHEEALREAEDDTDPNYDDIPAGFKRKSISSE